LDNFFHGKKGNSLCLILFAYDCHPRYHLILAANRDEFYARPSLPACFWDDNPTILGGRDLQEGGTWLGITTTGYFAALTNYRDPSTYKPQAPSRGHLVRNYLETSVHPKTYIEQLPDGGRNYNGFNLLLGTRESLFYYSNREEILHPVSHGVHGLSNNLLDVPWPKVAKGKEALALAVQNKDIDVEEIFSILIDREQPNDECLPKTGVSLEKERMLAPAFIISPNYGTRSTTLLLIDRNLKVQFWERTFKPKQPNNWNQLYYEFMIID